MKLNCRPGDLAVVIKSECGHIGKIVKCMKLHQEGIQVDAFRSFFGATWEIDRQLTCTDGIGGKFLLPYFKDDNLRPIRNQPGEDETLTWAPVPQKETV